VPRLQREIAGRAEVIVSPYKYDRPVKAEDAPPYDAERYYDAKLWKLVKEKASPGALVWNVAGDLESRT
jgi:hypothetical protein